MKRISKRIVISKGVIKGITTILALVMVSLLSLSAVISRNTLAVAPVQVSAISIDTINGNQPPFNFICPTNPLFNPLSITGSGVGEAPPGQIQQYKVQIDWGDGFIDNGLGTFNPASGQGPFSFTFSAGPHSYSGGNHTITARLYHSQPPGNDNQADVVVSVEVCVVEEGAQLTVYKQVVNDEGGILSSPDFNIYVKAGGQDVSNSPASGSETGTIYNLSPGTFVVSEDSVSGYNHSFSGDCDSEGSVTLSSGDVKTCTLTNDDILPEPFCGDDEINGNEICEIGDSQPCQTQEGYNGYQECDPDCMGWGECISEEHCGDGIINDGETCEYDIDCDEGYFCDNCFCELITECESGDTQSCDTGLSGICKSGTETCIDGFWSGECVQDNQPLDEICDNGLDDNCDGYTDCEDESCFQDSVCQEPQCETGQTQSCNTGQLGICLAGTQTCDGEGFWGSCVQDNESTTEICDDNLDNDCDGYTDCDDSDCEQDEACFTPPEPYCGDGIVNGEEECEYDQDCGEGMICMGCVCESQPPEPVCGDYIVNGSEECDDGNTEDGDGCSANCTIEQSGPTPCTTGQTKSCSTGQSGICSAGTQTCTDGVWGSCVQDNQPTTEDCSNGLDDDCDGSKDCSDSDCFGDIACYNPGPGPSCLDLDSDGYNAYNQYFCLSGNDCDDGNPDVNPGAAEICTNGLDDDCDGSTDCSDSECLTDPACYQSPPGPDCSSGAESSCDTGKAGVCSSGTKTCVAGVWAECVQDSESITEVCNNGLDDNCNGLTDCNDPDCALDPACYEGPGPGPEPGCTPGFYQLCYTGQLGACGAGTQICNPESIWGFCIPDSLPFPEDCLDGVDNDCDGETDCLDSDCSAFSACQVIPPGPTPACTFGETQSCDTDVLGVCAEGVQTCTLAAVWGDCIQTEQPITEDCLDGVDNDCDG